MFDSAEYINEPAIVYDTQVYLPEPRGTVAGGGAAPDSEDSDWELGPVDESLDHSQSSSSSDSSSDSDSDSDDDGPMVITRRAPTKHLKARAAVRGGASDAWQTESASLLDRIKRQHWPGEKW